MHLRVNNILKCVSSICLSGWIEHVRTDDDWRIYYRPLQPKWGAQSQLNGFLCGKGLRYHRWCGFLSPWVASLFRPWTYRSLRSASYRLNIWWDNLLFELFWRFKVSTTNEHGESHGKQSYHLHSDTLSSLDINYLKQIPKLDEHRVESADGHFIQHAWHTKKIVRAKSSQQVLSPPKSKEWALYTALRGY